MMCSFIVHFYAYKMYVNLSENNNFIKLIIHNLLSIVALITYLCHGSKNWIMPANARAVLHVCLFTVAHLIKFRS